MSKLKKILFNPWVVGIGTAVVAGLIIKLIDLIAGLNIWSKLIEWGILILQQIQMLIDIRIPLKIILALFTGLLLLNLLKKKYLSLRFRKVYPVFWNYNQEIIQGILYRWEYEFINKKWLIGRIQEHCPQCVCKIVNRQCPACNVNFIDLKEREGSEALIIYAIEKKFQINGFVELGN